MSIFYSHENKKYTIYNNSNYTNFKLYRKKAVIIITEKKTIISLICDTTWATNVYETENGTGQTTYNFSKSGTYKRTDIITDKSEEEKKSEYKGNWSFGDPSFSTIYFGGNHFWEIKELTKSKFSFYSIHGDWTDPSVYKEYIELTPYNPPKY